MYFYIPYIYLIYVCVLCHKIQNNDSNDIGLSFISREVAEIKE